MIRFKREELDAFFGQEPAHLQTGCLRWVYRSGDWTLFFRISPKSRRATIRMASGRMAVLDIEIPGLHTVNLLHERNPVLEVRYQGSHPDTPHDQEASYRVILVPKVYVEHRSAPRPAADCGTRSLFAMASGELLRTGT